MFIIGQDSEVGRPQFFFSFQNTCLLFSRHYSGKRKQGKREKEKLRLDRFTEKLTPRLERLAHGGDDFQAPDGMRFYLSWFLGKGRKVVVMKKRFQFASSPSLRKPPGMVDGGAPFWLAVVDAIEMESLRP